MTDIESRDFVRTAPSPELKRAVAVELRAHLDALLLPEGFLPIGQSGDYRRRSPDGTQVIRNWLAYTGSAPSRLDAMLGPQIELTYPQVNVQLRRYAPAIMDDRKGSYNEAIYLGRYLGESTHWPFTSLAELRTRLRETIGPALANDVLPVLAQVVSIQGFACLAPEKANRLFKSGRGRWEDWATAKLITGDLDGAKAVLQNHFKPTTRDGQDLQFLADEIDRRRAATIPS